MSLLCSTTANHGQATEGKEAEARGFGDYERPELTRARFTGQSHLTLQESGFTGLQNDINQRKRIHLGAGNDALISRSQCICSVEKSLNASAVVRRCESRINLLC